MRCGVRRGHPRTPGLALLVGARPVDLAALPTCMRVCTPVRARPSAAGASQPRTHSLWTRALDALSAATCMLMAGWRSCSCSCGPRCNMHAHSSVAYMRMLLKSAASSARIAFACGLVQGGGAGARLSALKLAVAYGAALCCAGALSPPPNASPPCAACQHIQLASAQA